MAKRVLTLPTNLARQLAQEEGLYFAPRQLTALAKKGVIPSVTTAEGIVILIDGTTARAALRNRKR